MAYDGMNDFEGEGAMPGGKPSPGRAPECSAKYSPSNGGYDASSIESEGAPGDKGAGDGGAEPTGNTEEGNYASEAHTIGDYPHGNEDPALGGPPLGTTAGPNGDVDMGDRSPGGAEPNERLDSGTPNRGTGY